MNEINFPKRHSLSAQVTDEEIECGEFDDFGCSYSDDGHRLMQFPVEIGERLKHYSVAEGTVVVCDSAFEGCDGFHSIELPESLKVIGELAFYGCERLSELSLPEGLLAIGKNAFSNCAKLNSITLPASVKIIGANPFYRSGITEIIIRSEHFAIYSESLTSLSDGTLIAYLGDSADYHTPDGVSIIGEDAFHEVKSLRRLSLSLGVKEIDRFAVVGCSELREISLPSSLEAIHQEAFSFCRNLELITAPASLPADVRQAIRDAAEQAGAQVKVRFIA